MNVLINFSIDDAEVLYIVIQFFSRYNEVKKKKFNNSSISYNSKIYTK